VGDAFPAGPGAPLCQRSRKSERQVHHGHDPFLMSLSVLIAIQGSFVSLVLAREIGRFVGLRRRLVLAMSAVTLGSSIWAMHFIGMLAYHMPASATYDLFLTLLSFLIAVLAVGIGYGITTVMAAGVTRDAAAAVFTGGGIAGMHYVGMAALRGQVELAYQPDWVALSILIGVIAAGISQHLAFGTRLQARAALGAVVMGLAISGMHYAAMYGTTIQAGDMAGMVAAGNDSHVLDRGLLAMVVAVVAFVICGASLLLLVPTQPRPLEVAQPDASAIAIATATVPIMEASQPTSLPPVEPAATPLDDSGIAVRLGSSMIRLEPRAIAAIRADGRYTHLQDREREYFCNLSITELERRLDPRHFMRVHRSHILQLQQVKAIRRKGDGAFAVIAARSEIQVPVSRSALPKLKARLMLPDHPDQPPEATVVLS
jgi:NO-binding membrane sensor protein with MHYT domain